MSTKWNNNQKLQKTPKVCKKGPEDLPEDLRQFRYYPLQAFATWSDNNTPLIAAIAGQTILAATPLFFVHEGHFHVDDARIDLLLTYNPATLIFHYTVTLRILGVFVDQVAVDFADPTANLPFQAGLFTWQETGLSRIVTSKIFS